jgi:MFS family permease
MICVNSFQNVRGVSPLLCTLYFIPDASFAMLTVLIIARITPHIHAKILCMAGILFLLSAPLLMVTSPAQQSYWHQAFPTVAFSSIGGMIVTYVADVFISSSMRKDPQGLKQVIFNTLLQIGSVIGLALAPMIAHAGGVADGASKEELLQGYRYCFWFSVGVLAIPFMLSFFLRKETASETREEAAAKGKHQGKDEVKKQDKNEGKVGPGQEGILDEKVSEQGGWNMGEMPS